MRVADNSQTGCGPEAPARSERRDPLISFVIPAHNEERLIAGTLAALREAAVAVREPHEILVVDDGSTDRTAAIAREQGARVVTVAHRQIAATRNAGARESHGDLLVFVDADTRVHSALIGAALEAMRAGAVGGGCPIRFDGRVPTWARVIHPFLLWIQRTCCFAGGCFLFCTREGFTAVGGFDERLYAAEEIAMSQALKRHGRFVLLREPVRTSGRKLRTYTGRETLRVLGYLLARGSRSIESRDGLDLWYGPRREDPEPEERAAAS